MKHYGKIKTNKKVTLGICALSLISFFMPMSANAALFDVPLPSNTFITLNGFDWAWGASCAENFATGCDTLSFAFQTGEGWSIAQASDMTNAPTALDFLFPGANVPFNGADPVTGATFGFLNSAYTGDGACATAYFTLGDGDIDCGWSNGGGQNIGTEGWFNQNGETRPFAEVLFVRGISEVPVPAAFWLFGTALIGFVGMSRRRKVS
jgi:hypothetical protein